MALTKATQVVKAALQRESTLKKEFDPSKIPYNYHITNSEYAMGILKEFAQAGSLSKSNLSDCISILEAIEEKGVNAKHIATYIANEIIPNSISEAVDLSNISKSSRSIIESAVKKNELYDRLLHNQKMLEKRFNISETCRGKRTVKSICESLCTLIDTYEIPLTYKYNIALENVIFSLVQNNFVFESDMEVANYVTEYFMMRDPIIYDSTYKKYQKLLKESVLYNIEEATGTVAALLNNDGNYFGNKVSKVLNESNDERIKDFIPLFEAVHSESDAAEYIKKVSDHIEHNQVTTLDLNRIYYSVDMISKHSGVNPSFIHLTLSDIFGDTDIKPTVDVDFPDKSQDIFASIPSVNNIIAENNACQCKDYESLNHMIDQLMNKKNTAIFGYIEDIYRCMYNNLKMINFDKEKACDKVLHTIKVLYQSTTSFAQISDLNRFGKAILLNPELGSDEIIKNFQKEVEKLIEFNSDTYSSLSESDIFSIFKSEEDVLEAFTKLCIAAEDVMHKSVDKDALDYIVETCVENRWIDTFYEAYIYLNAPIKLFESAYEKVYDSKTMRAFEDIPAPIYPFQQYSIRSLFATIEATNMFESLNESFTYLEEAVNNNGKKVNDKNKMEEIKKKGTNFITTMKLGLMNMKKKIQKMDTKQQEMWRTLDAYGNKFMRSLSDDDEKRRAQLLQGQAIPSFSKCIKTGIGLIVSGVATANILVPMIAAFGILGRNKFLNDKQRKQLIGEIEIELKIVEKQLEVADKDDDMTKYRQLLMVQRKLQHEAQRLRFQRKPFKLGGKR